MADRDVILVTDRLTRTVAGPDGPRAIVEDLSYTFSEGRFYTVVGPSGAGKTSLLRLLNRLDEPTGGAVYFRGRDYRSISPCALRRRIGYLFQTPYLFPGTVRDNLRYARADISDHQAFRCLRAAALPEEYLERPVDRLSLGEQQRVALARLLVLEPAVLLLDEPTSSLDPTATETIERLVRSLVTDHALTVIMVTHQPEQALRLGGETLLLVRGRLVESGPAEQVLRHPSTDEGRRYRDRELV